MLGDGHPFLRAGVSSAQAAQSMAYLRDISDACSSVCYLEFSTVYRDVSQSSFKQIADAAVAEARRWRTDIAANLKAIAGTVAECKPVFASATEDLLQIARGGTGPLTQDEVNRIQNACAYFLWYAQELPKRWYAFAKLQNDKVVGLLPGWTNWLATYERSLPYHLKFLQQKHPNYLGDFQKGLEWFDGKMNGILADVQTLYERQGNTWSDSQTGIRLRFLCGLTLTVCVMPIRGSAQAAAPLKQRLASLERELPEFLSHRPWGEAGAVMVVTFFTGAFSAYEKYVMSKNLSTFTTTWLAFGTLVENIVKTFQRSLSEKSREVVILDVEDAQEYWKELERYAGALPAAAQVNIIPLSQFG